MMMIVVMRDSRDLMKLIWDIALIVMIKVLIVILSVHIEIFQ